MHDNCFQILAHGSEVDLDELLDKANFEFTDIWRKGDDNCSLFPSPYRTSGIRHILGDGQSLRMAVQCQIAEQWIASHTTLLETLRNCPGVSTFSLGLQYVGRIGPSTTGTATSAPPSLLAACGAAGLKLTIYFALRRHDRAR